MLRKLTVTFVFAALMIAALFTTWGITGGRCRTSPLLNPARRRRVRSDDSTWRKQRAHINRSLVGQCSCTWRCLYFDGPLYRSNMIWWYITIRKLACKVG